MRASAFEFLEMQALERVEISFIGSTTNYLHELPESFDDISAETGVEVAVCLQPVKLVVVKINFHLPLMIER